MADSRKVQNQYHECIIEQIVDLIKEIGGDQIALVVLFGSFARGDWVYDSYVDNDGNCYEYISDYDFLIASKNEGARDNLRLQNKIKDQIYKKHLDRLHPVAVIVDSLGNINSAIEKSQYFFLDIKKDGKILFNDGGFELAEPQPKSEEERRVEAKADYEYWMESSLYFLNHFNIDLQDGVYSKAAFQLHQAAESLYNCTLMTFTGYKPKIHNLKELEKSCLKYDRKFLTIFPKHNQKINYKKHRLVPKDQIILFNQSEDPRDWFELLKIAYIDARYNRHYFIGKKQLEYLGERVEELRVLVEKVCGDYLENKKSK